MSLELNKCPLCLRSAVDYRQLEFIARFATFVNLPRCPFCFGVPPSHNTPENRSSREEIKYLIDLVDFHLERSDKTYYDPVNWRAITFALQIHQNRFQPQKPFLIHDKLGFPQMDPIKLQDLLVQIQQSKIANLPDVQDEINLVLTHQQLETRLAVNQLTSQDIPYFLKCGFTQEELLNQLALQQKPKSEDTNISDQVNTQSEASPGTPIKPTSNARSILTRSANDGSVPLTLLSISKVKKQLKIQQQRKSIRKSNQLKKPKVKLLKEVKKAVKQGPKSHKSKTKNHSFKSTKRKRGISQKAAPAQKKDKEDTMNRIMETQQQLSVPQQECQVQQQLQQFQSHISSQKAVTIIPKPIITYVNDPLFKNSHLTDEIILIKTVSPKKFLIGEQPNFKVEQLIRTFGDSMLKSQPPYEIEKQKNDMKFLYNLK